MSEVVDQMGGVRRFFDGAAFPTFCLSLLFCYELLLIWMLVAPPAPSGLGAFAEDFRIWCYGYDPATGRMDIGLIMAILTPPGMLAGIFVVVWWNAIREALQQPMKYLPYALGAIAFSAALIASLSFLGNNSNTSSAEMGFPAEELRTAHRAPEIALTNQLGEPFDLAVEAKGNVVLLTAVYAACPHTCPAIIQQAKRSVEALPPELQDDLTVVAVTMDPANDSPEVLLELAEMHDLDPSTFQFLTGEPEKVEKILDEMSMARNRDEETGIIDHANLYLLLDRQGKVAYRLTLGERQERWMESALNVLLNEELPTAN